MKSVSTIALGAALALGGVLAAAVSMPAVAKEKAPKAAKAPSYNLSKPVREAVAAAQAAIAKQDYATAQASLTQAQSASTTPDDKFVVASVLYDVGRGTNNPALQAQAIDGMIDSGKAEPDKIGTMYLAQGQMAYQAKNYQKAERAFENAIKSNTTDTNVYALLVESKVKTGKPAEALTVLESAIAKQRAAGQKVPAEWYGRGVAIGFQARLAKPVEQITQQWLVDYPSPSNWRDSLITYRDLNKLDADTELDTMRLLRTAKGLKGERDYYEYAEAVYLKFPGEGKSVIDEGVSAGMLKPDAGSNTRMMLDASSKRLAADKADLASAEKSARAAGTGVAARATADSYLGYGEYAKAIDLYRVALTKGGVDPNVVNTRLGMALAKAGQKAEAKQVFASITGPRASLAKYWTIWLDQQA